MVMGIRLSAKSDRFMEFLANLLQQRGEKTIRQLRSEADVSNATIYRWVRLIERHFPQAVQIISTRGECARITVRSING